jgi:hypothetical protein
LPAQGEDLAEPANRLSLDWRANGWLHLDGDLDPETATLFTAQVDARTPPPPAEEGPTPFRSADRRRGQGLAEWVNLGRDGTGDVIDGGERPQVTVTIGVDELSRGLGMATLGAEPAADLGVRGAATGLRLQDRVRRPRRQVPPRPWTSAARPASSRCTSAAPWRTGTRAARSPAVSAHPSIARRTMSWNGATAALPPSKTSPYFAGGITASSITPTGRSG